MRERLKSLVLALLLLLAVGLSYLSLTLGLHTDGRGLLGTLLTDGNTTDIPTEETFSATPAARPDSLCLLRSDGLYRAEGDFEGLWELVMPLYEEAMGSGSKPESLTGTAFSALLKPPALLISYDSPQQLSLLRIWCDAPAEDSSLTVSTAVMCAADDGVILAFRDGEGKCWKMSTAASVQELLELCSGEEKANAVLALSDPTYAALFPEEPVADGQLILPLYTADTVISASASELPWPVLTAFSLNPYLAKIYPDAGGGLVYVEDRSTLAVTAEGDLVYSAPEGGVAYEQSANEDDATRAARACEAAYQLLTNVWNELGADGVLSLDSLQYDESAGQYTLRFQLEVGGIFLYRADKYWAQAVISDGQITDVTLCPRRLTAGENVTLIPMRQAAATLDGIDQWRLRVLLQERTDGVFEPAICRMR